jgi:putative hydrolase of the HAD superfamily
VDASGLARHFSAVIIVAEKNVDTYRWLARERSLRPSETWMIGNSPRSDIIPARQAGWNAVFIPNEHTWVLELDDLGPDDRILRLRAFADLPQHF